MATQSNSIKTAINQIRNATEPESITNTMVADTMNSLLMYAESTLQEALRAQWMAGKAADGIRRNLFVGTNDSTRNWGVSPAKYRIQPTDFFIGQDYYEGVEFVSNYDSSITNESFVFAFDASRVRPGRFYSVSFDVSYTPRSAQHAPVRLEVGLIIPAVPSVGVSRNPKTEHTRRQVALADKNLNYDGLLSDENPPSQKIDLCFLGQRLADGYDIKHVCLHITFNAEAVGDWSSIFIRNLKLEEVPDADTPASKWCEAPEDLLFV